MVDIATSLGYIGRLTYRNLQGLRKSVSTRAPKILHSVKGVLSVCLTKSFGSTRDTSLARVSSANGQVRFNLARKSPPVNVSLSPESKGIKNRIKIKG